MGAASKETTPQLSVVIPLYNEQENVGPCYRELTDVLTRAGLDYELIFVDDGSRDATFQHLEQLATDDPRTTLLQFRRNFGQTAAMAAGFHLARSPVVVPIDGDLQNDPADIPALIARLDEPPGYDIVSGWRRKRKDKMVSRRLPSMTANWLIGWLTGIRLHDYGCTLKAYRREVLADVDLYGEMHRFIPAICSWRGARVTEMVVDHRPRTAGQAKYGLGRTVKVLLDLITVKFMGSYLTKPIYFFGKLGLLSLAAALVCLGLALYHKFGPEDLHLNRNPLTLLAGILVIVSVQVVLMGLMTEMLIRIYHESQAKPIYAIRRMIRCGQSSGRQSSADEAAPQRGHAPAGSQAG